MAGVGVGQRFVRDIENAVEGRHKLVALDRFPKQIVHLRHRDVRRIADVCRRAQAGAQKRHQQRRRHAFAGNIGDHQSNLIVIDLYPIVVVAGNFLGRKVVGADVVTLPTADPVPAAIPAAPDERLRAALRDASFQSTVRAA